MEKSNTNTNTTELNYHETLGMFGISNYVCLANIQIGYIHEQIRKSLAESRKVTENRKSLTKELIARGVEEEEATSLTESFERTVYQRLVEKMDDLAIDFNFNSNKTNEYFKAIRKGYAIPCLATQKDYRGEHDISTNLFILDRLSGNSKDAYSHLIDCQTEIQEDVLVETDLDSYYGTKFSTGYVGLEDLEDNTIKEAKVYDLAREIKEDFQKCIESNCYIKEKIPYTCIDSLYLVTCLGEIYNLYSHADMVIARELTEMLEYINNNFNSEFERDFFEYNYKYASRGTAEIIENWLG